ncbi:hypothetical protein GMA8713_04461 [Grimontia marina]|uniref:Uncharacterized protein n=1 Tax=Grimontia marina TaxID=646534 RepID=A0A128FI05_9GAMM|nr:hypothetical protein GMA8713_04461 [Grimontia marina]
MAKFNARILDIECLFATLFFYVPLSAFKLTNAVGIETVFAIRMRNVSDTNDFALGGFFQ